MEQKLKLVFQNLTLQLAFKAGVFAGLLYFVKFADFGPVSIFVFFAGALILYAKPLFRTFEVFIPFAILSILSLLASYLLSDSRYFILSAIIFSVLFYLVLGIKDLALIQRMAWYRFVNLSLVYTALLIFFYTNQEYFLLKISLLFLTIFLLSKSLIKKRLVYWITAFLMLEAIWAVSFLSIGFVSSANLSILIYFIITDLALVNIEGALTKKKILIDTSIFIILLVAIFALSRWSL